jgi:P4 family phage/plasmid primase-like protien
MSQTPKPRALPTLFDAIPPELKALPQWVGWRFVWRAGKPGEPGKWTKAPFRADGKGAAKSTDPTTWATFDQAYANVRRLGFDGVGFVFSPEDQYFGVDLDACRDKETGQLTPEAEDWVKRFGTYCEVSPSGTGVKLIGLGALPEGMSGRRNATTGAECYDRGRYFTVTGQRLTESPESCSDAPEVLTAFLAHHFPKREAAPVSDRSQVQPLDMDDAAIVALGMKEKSGGFASLWSGSIAGYPGDSEADAALAARLCFYCHNDTVRVERIMRTCSSRYRDKWDSQRGGGTYLSYTIEKVAAGTTEFYSPPGIEATLPERQEEVRAKAKPLPERQEEAKAEARAVRLGEFNKTDAGNAERLIARNGQDLRFVPGLGWRVWEGKRWAADETTVTRYARETIRALYGEAAELLKEAHQEPDKDIRKQLAASAEELSRFAIRSESTRALAAMVEQSKSFSEIAADAGQFDLKPWQVPFQNGVWDRGQWRGHKRQDFTEHLLPVCYEKDADRSEWLALLDRMTGGDAQFARTLQDVAGYCLSGASTLRLLPWAYGPKGTGKSTFAELLQTVLGASGKTVDSTLLSGDREDERLGAAIRGMRAIFLPEAGRKRLDAETLKSLTGGDRRPARNLYSNVTISIVPSWAVFAVANDPPAMNAHDEALRDRVIALPFVHRLDQGEELTFRDGKRLEEVRRNQSGALVTGFVAWVVEGLERIHRAQEVYRAPLVTEHTRKFWDETDPLTPFWEGLNEAEIERGMLASALHRAYVAWCDETGNKRPLQGRAFAAACRAAGLEDARGTGGVRLWKKPPPSMNFSSSSPNSDRVTDNTPFSENSPKREDIEDFTKNTPESVTLSLNDDMEDPFAPGGSMYHAPEFEEGHL